MSYSQLLEIADTYGSPTYVYDAALIEKQYQRLTSAFQSVKSLVQNHQVKWK